MEAIITSELTGLLFGSIVAHFTTLDIIPQLEKTEKKNGVKPRLWLECHKNLNAALIQLRRKAEVNDDMAGARQRNLQLQRNPHFILMPSQEFTC